MRIVYLNPGAQLGGGELSLIDLMGAVGQVDPNIDRRLVVTTDGPIIERATAVGVQVAVEPMPASLAGVGDSALRGRGKLGTARALALKALPAGSAALGFARRLAGHVRSLEPTVVHSNGMKTHLLLSLARFRSAPVIWHLRDFPGSRPLMARALRMARGSVKGVIAISHAVGRDASNVLGPKVPVHVIYDAIDTAYFTPGPGDGAALDRAAGVEPPSCGTLRIGLIATYARWKGQDLLIEAARNIPRDRDVRFYIIGGPIYQTQGSQFSVDELRGLAERAGVADRFAFVPFQRDTASVYRSLDIVVHASTHPEPFGRTIAEAMACGRPVVVSASGGAAELFTEGEDAVGFRMGDPSSLRDTLVGLVDDPAKRERIALQAPTTAVARYSWPRLGREVVEIYRSLA